MRLLHLDHYQSYKMRQKWFRCYWILCALEFCQSHLEGYWFHHQLHLAGLCLGFHHFFGLWALGLFAKSCSQHLRHPQRSELESWHFADYGLIDLRYCGSLQFPLRSLGRRHHLSHYWSSCQRKAFVPTWLHLPAQWPGSFAHKGMPCWWRE